jgi:hypothetical protein
VVELELFFEGKTDRSLFRRLLNHSQVEGVVFYEPKTEDQGGKDWLKTNVAQLLKQSRALRFGLVLDGDDDPAAAWQRWRDALNQADVPVVDKQDLPADYPNGGFNQGNFGIWMITPDLGLPGDLESLKVRLIQPGDKILGPAQEAVRREPELLKKVSKAVFGTWLAWQRRGAGMVEAEAWLDNLLKIDGETAQDFVAWVQRLVNTPAE